MKNALKLTIILTLTYSNQAIATSSESTEYWAIKAIELGTSKKIHDSNINQGFEATYQNMAASATPSETTCVAALKPELKRLIVGTTSYENANLFYAKKLTSKYGVADIKEAIKQFDSGNSTPIDDFFSDPIMMVAIDPFAIDPEYDQKLHAIIERHMAPCRNAKENQ